MRSFCDTEGREWKLRISVLSVSRVQDETGFLLTKIFDDNASAYIELVSDLSKLGEVLWCLCEKQADELGIGAEQFADSLAGQPLDDAVDALGRAVADFFPNRDSQVFLTAMDKAREAKEQMTTEALAKVTELEPASLANGSMDSVLNSQESSDSNRGTIPLAS